MKKVLFTATIDGHIRVFHQPYLNWFKENDFEVHVAAKGDESFVDATFKYPIDFQRSPLSRQNWKAYKQLKSIIEKETFDIIHCHTPTAGVLTRLAARKSRKKGTKVIYTAHGFHFYKGAGFKNWFLFFTIEWLLSFFTDVLITINKEDFSTAKKYFGSNKVRHVHGVGVDLNKYNPPTLEENKRLRDEIGVSENDFVLVYPAEFSHRKNQPMLIKAVHKAKEQIPSIKLLLAGRGDFEPLAKLVSELNLDDTVINLGFRYDIDKFIRSSDIGVSTSRQEGLPINVLEAMSSGKAMVVTNVRGNYDLVDEGENGFLVELGDIDSFANRIIDLFRNNRDIMQTNSVKKSHNFSLEIALPETIEIYKSLL